MNGSSYAGVGDSEAGVSLEWPNDGGTRYVQWALPTGLRNMSAFDYLTVRTAQVTNHPYNALDAIDTKFSIELKDSTGFYKNIQVAAYKAGVPDPYKLNFEGPLTPGGSNEFVTLRVRLQDFRNNGSTLNLSNITQIRLRFGSSVGTASGRVILDDLELVRD